MSDTTNDHLITRTATSWRIVFYLAWPVLVQQLLILAVSLYDQYLAGTNAPKDPSQHIPFQAAQTTANYIAWFISSCSTIVVAGATAMVARFIGARDMATAQKVTHQSLILALVAGILGTLIMLLLLPTVVRLLALQGTAAQSAVAYLKPIIWLITCQLIAQAGIGCLIGAGDTRTGPIVLSLVALANIPLSWAAFHGWGPIPAMGFFGIGLGTALSHVLGCIIVLLVLIRGRFGLKLSLKLLAPHRNLLYRILRISIPATIDSASIGLCQFWFLSIVNSLGDVAAAAHGNAIRCEGLGYMSGIAFATAAAAMVGQNLGANKPDQAARSAWIALGMGALLMSVMGVLFYSFAYEMMHFFNPYDHQQATVAAGVPILRLVAFAMPPLAAIIILQGALRGAGDTRYPILITWIGFLLVRIPLAYYLTHPHLDLGSLGTLEGYNFGLIGAWSAMFADLLLRGALFVHRFLLGRWKLVQV
ncbi:MAG: MATE family efflux transporter [Zavarzinella sp.]